MVERGLTLEFGDNRRLMRVLGPHDANLAHMEWRLGVTLTPRGNVVQITGGDAVSRDLSARVLSEFYERGPVPDPVTPGDIDERIGSLQTGSAGPAERGRDGLPAITFRTPGGPVTARNENQARFMTSLKSETIVFASGPAGTGKTFLAVAHAVSQLSAGDTDRLILSRPALEAGERIGFLPGDMREKVDPYLRPLMDGVYRLMRRERAERCLGTGTIEILPLAFMRGRTFDNAIVLLDEAQNCTFSQLKMFLTRLGSDAQLVICGDPTQDDLPDGNPSGLRWVTERLQNLKGITHVRFTSEDIVRHALIGKMLSALDRCGGGP